MKKLSKAIMAGIVALSPITALAAIDGTHHDMTQAPVSSAEKCAFCHSVVLGASAISAYGKVGNFCVRVCHVTGAGIAGTKPNVIPQDPGYFYYNESGTGGTLTNVAAAGATETVLSLGHGMNINLLTTIDVDGNVTAVRSSNWPHANDAGSTTMECTTCHAVHDNTNPPFLNAPFTTLCQQCHPMKASNINDTGTTGGSYANHPSDFHFSVDRAASYNAFAKSADSTGTRMGPRTLRYTGSATAPAAANAYVGFTSWVTNVNNSGTSWQLGGHVLQNQAPYLPMGAVGPATLGKGTNDVFASAPGATSNRFGCYSCHSAHQSNASGAIDNVVSNNNTLLLGRNDTAASTGGDVCYGCHGSTAAPQDPGVSGYGHPVNNDKIINTWTVPMSADWTTPGAGAGFINANMKYSSTKTLYGAAGTAVSTPRCVACHDVHQGEPGLMAFRKINATQPTTACMYCHTSAETTRVADMHHPGSVATNYTTNGFANAAWATIDGNGNLTSGLSCPDCHIGDGTTNKRSTAHNWK